MKLVGDMKFIDFEETLDRDLGKVLASGKRQSRAGTPRRDAFESSVDEAVHTNEGIQHHEEKVIELLKKGASPYFFNRWNVNPNWENYGYLEVAFLLCHLDSEWCDQWDHYGLTLLRKDINSLEDEDLETIVFALSNAAANQRILYLVDKYISDEARAKGEELMRKYDAYYPILRHKPESDVNILNNGSGTPNSL